MKFIKSVTSKSSSPASHRALEEFDGHEMLIALSDEGVGLRAYVGIHNTSRGPALGGTRVQTYATDTEAIRDVLNLSRAMSYKCALADLPYGGGKGVIVLNRHAKIQPEILKAYARNIENLRGLFKTGTDVGVSDADVAEMAKHTSHMLGVTKADRGNLSTSSSAALGVFFSMKAALLQLYGTDSFNGKSVAIKGVGKLGAELARLSHEAGATIVIADVDDKKCQEIMSSMPGVSTVPVHVIHKQKVDIYAPCALGSEFTSKVVKSLQCRAIVGGANNQLPNLQAGEAIFRRNILYAPDYIANAGGLIYVADELEPGGFSKARVLERVKNIQMTMQSIFQRAAAENKATHSVADTIARERIQSAR